MKIVTDRGCDLSEEQTRGLELHYVPMHLTLDGKTYSSGVDITSQHFYELLDQTESFPTTSQAGVGDFMDLYRKLAQSDPEILSIHISSGLSGTLNSARTAAEMVPEARVTLWDTMTLSGPQGWQVEAAAKALKAGWPLDKALELAAKVRAGTVGMFTLDTMKYLIHGGRISHLKGLLASLLQIRPIISVEKEHGKYYTVSQERTMKRALQKMPSAVAGLYPGVKKMRAQLIHGHNLEGIARLKEAMDAEFECTWLPTVTVGPILGAHTGSSLVGMSVGPADIFAGFPDE